MHAEEWYFDKRAVNLVVSPLQAQENERRVLKISKCPKITKTTGYECTGNDMQEHYKINVKIYLSNWSPFLTPLHLSFFPLYYLCF